MILKMLNKKPTLRVQRAMNKKAKKEIVKKETETESKNKITADDIQGGTYQLLGAIVKSALYDYTLNINQLIQNRKDYYNKRNAKKGITGFTKYQRNELNNLRNRLVRDKSTAEYFFTKSEIFKTTGLDFTYLLKNKKRILYGKENIL